MKKESVVHAAAMKYSEITAVRWDPSFQFLAYANSLGDIQVLDYRRKAVYASHAQKSYNGVKALVFSPHNNSQLFAGGSDG